VRDARGAAPAAELVVKSTPKNPLPVKAREETLSRDLIRRLWR
jgi:hypothetical protein